MNSTIPSIAPPWSARFASERGMLTVQAGDNVVRLLPPLIIGEEEIDLACATIDAACAALKVSASENA